VLTTVAGVYKNGNILLDEDPIGLEVSKVLVTFLRENKNRIPDSRMMTFGMIGNDGTYEEPDFNAAKSNVQRDEF
jgi:hypothetical protein